MKFNKMGTILIAENEAELIWYALGEWYCDERIKTFNDAYDKWFRGGSRGFLRFEKVKKSSI